MKIQHTAIVGMGALGLLYGQHIQQAAGPGSVCFVMDAPRLEKHRRDRYTINGQPQEFPMTEYSQAGPADLVIIATKQTGLEEALEEMAPLVGPHTVLLSVMNGITSEEAIARRFGDENLVWCVAIGMDAMRDGTDLRYTQKGRLQIGAVSPRQQPALDAVREFFERIGLPHSVEEDIRRAMWAKFLLNVGINQTCMVFKTTYQGALDTPEYFRMMSGAMQEVIALAQKEGVRLTQEDYENYLKILRTLDPNGYPSMRQDALAHRKSEVDLFAGTVIRLARRHNLAVPCNEFFLRRVREMEAAY